MNLSNLKARQVPLTRRGFKQGPEISQGGRFYVVKRKRRPNAIANRRLGNAEEDNELVPATAAVNYQTDKSFHHETVLENGERHGQYGYIDPIGVRRVVTYTTGAGGSSSPQNQGILKAKENDFVGPNTYFVAN